MTSRQAIGTPKYSKSPQIQISLSTMMLFENGSPPPSSATATASASATASPSVRMSVRRQSSSVRRRLKFESQGLQQEQLSKNRWWRLCGSSGSACSFNLFRPAQFIIVFCGLLVILSFLGSARVTIAGSYPGTGAGAGGPLVDDSMDPPPDEETIITIMQIPEDKSRQPRIRINKRHNTPQSSPSPLPAKLSFSGTHHHDKPRIVFLDQPHPSFQLPSPRTLEDDPMLHAPPGMEAAPQDHMKPEPEEGCVPTAEWQTRSFPTCNMFHELNMKESVDAAYDVTTPSLELLGTGWFRSTWKWSSPLMKTSVVMKTLRFEREFYDEYYELHRRDALAMERLSHSAFVMDIYGYCGQSALNEIADFPNGLNSLEKFDRQMRGRKGPDINFLKLQLASSVAVAVAHVHGVDNGRPPSMVHYDLNPRNVAIVASGKPKLNDFNTAEFLHVHKTTRQPCGFRSRLHEPWWRAPEEVKIGNENKLTEKADVFALGNVLFHILTTHSPHGKMKKERMEMIRKEVLAGKLPELMPEYKKSNDEGIKAIVRAIKMCFEYDPKKRTSSKKVADMLMDTLARVQNKRQKKRKGK